jgi:hypothetical protein
VHGLPDAFSASTWTRNRGRVRMALADGHQQRVRDVLASETRKRQYRFLCRHSYSYPRCFSLLSFQTPIMHAALSIQELLQDILEHCDWRSNKTCNLRVSKQWHEICQEIIWRNVGTYNFSTFCFLRRRLERRRYICSSLSLDH